MAPLKRAPLKAVLFVAALALAGCGLGGDQGGVHNGVRDPIVAATVNGRPIYIEDVRAYAVSRGWIQETEDLDANSDAANQALNDLIEVRLFAMEAEARGLDRQPDIRRQLENARERVLANAIYDDLAQHATDPAAVERLYRENQSRLGEGDEVHLRHILFSTREAADAAKRRLDQGERFEALAFELSVERNTAPDGGDMGFNPLSDLTPALRQEVEHATMGGLIGPIQLTDGWHIFRLDDRRARGGPSLEELRPRITAWLAWQGATQLRERLERDARIERLREPAESRAPAGEVAAPADAPRQATRPSPTPEAVPGAAPPPFPFPQQQAPTPAPRPAPTDATAASGTQE
jgi:peptidyl-prolyl cis-trans isomerase C